MTIRRTYVLAEKWRQWGLWRMVLMARLWNDMNQADRNFMRSWINSQ